MKTFTIFPAIDLKDGKCVRLKQGNAAHKTIYSEDPIAMAKSWEKQGGTFLHIVDLDGAFSAKPAHTEIITAIAQEVNIPIQVGGGLRKTEHIEVLLNAGVKRVIIGTKALQSPELLKSWIDQFGDHIVVGLDARDGLVHVSGWVDDSTVDAYEFAQEMEQLGVSTIIFTDISRDGMLTGNNIEATSTICETVSCDIIASGGIGSVNDVQDLKALPYNNLVGAIMGKALYDGRIQLADVL